MPSGLRGAFGPSGGFGNRWVRLGSGACWVFWSLGKLALSMMVFKLPTVHEVSTVKPVVASPMPPLSTAAGTCQSAGTAERGHYNEFPKK